MYVMADLVLAVLTKPMSYEFKPVEAFSLEKSMTESPSVALMIGNSADPPG
jgi:hypothetical protein